MKCPMPGCPNPHPIHKNHLIDDNELKKQIQRTQQAHIWSEAASSDFVDVVAAATFLMSDKIYLLISLFQIKYVSFRHRFFLVVAKFMLNKKV